MPYQMFHDLFPEIAKAETRFVSIREGPGGPALPADDYGFCEMFCNEPDCDCRRVFFYVVARRRAEAVAVIAWGWEPREFYRRWLRDDDPELLDELKGPCPNSLSPQSELADDLTALVRDILIQDPLYVERIKRHYQMFRAKIESLPAEPFEEAGRRKKGTKSQKRKRRKRKSR
jgi:hypothetical protein